LAAIIFLPVIFLPFVLVWGEGKNIIGKNMAISGDEVTRIETVKSQSGRETVDFPFGASYTGTD
jgi:hypothetical protein